MLYQPVQLDFSRQILVFVHIPKTAGSALEEALAVHLGEDNCLLARDGKVGKIHATRIGKTIWSVRKHARNLVLRVRGIDQSLPKDYPKANLSQLRLLDGHFSLGNEPRTGRDPVYLTLVRDPVDRFLSDFYYRFDIRARWPEGKRERHKFWTYDVDRFVDFVYARRRWNELNLQCLYLGRENNFAAARRAIDNRVFLAAPAHRMDALLELLGPILGLKSAAAPRSNVGRARQGKAPPSEETLAKIREMVPEDQRLFEYVSSVFDDVYGKFGRVTPGVCSE
jgi:hypothetical protein